MRVSQKMIDAFKAAEGCQCHPEDEIGTRLQAILDLPEAKAVEAFTRAAAAHAVTEGTDEWNRMIEAWDTLSNEVRRDLLEGRS